MATKFRQCVIDKITELGTTKAAEFFGVSLGCVSNWKNGKVDPPLRAVEMVYKEPEATEPQKLTTWQGKDVLLLVPIYRSFSPHTHFTLFANYAKYGAEKIGMIMENRTLIHEARNILVDKALKTTSNWFIFVDDDMLIPCGNAELFNKRYGANLPNEIAGVNGISRLMSHPADKLIVGSLYFGRAPMGKAQCCSAFATPGESEKYRNGTYRGLRQEEWVAPGFMRIHRSVFEKLKEAIDKGEFPECKPKALDKWYGYFAPIQVGVGEDVSFGRRCKQIGIQSYVDASLVCLHAGECFYGPSNTRG